MLIVVLAYTFGVISAYWDGSYEQLKYKGYKNVVITFYDYGFNLAT